MDTLFDIEKIIKESGLSQKQIRKIQEEIRKEFPKHEMMYELHLMRAIEAEKNKRPAPKERKSRLQKTS